MIAMYVPYVSQWDDNAKLSRGDCGIVAACMCALWKGIKTTPDEMITKAKAEAPKKDGQVVEELNKRLLETDELSARPIRRAGGGGGGGGAGGGRQLNEEEVRLIHKARKIRRTIEKFSKINLGLLTDIRIVSDEF